jgi:hypothetical protein
MYLLARDWAGAGRVYTFMEFRLMSTIPISYHRLDLGVIVQGYYLQ